MTEEQIRQNAADYVYNFQPTGVITEDRLKCYIAGAHSRDKEIGKLKGRIERLRAILTVSDLNKEVLRNELDQLRSPWISVEERLPRIGQSCFLANFDKRRCGYGKFCADDGMVTRWERTEGGSTMIYCLHEVTHWMPIPELKKGE